MKSTLKYGIGSGIALGFLLITGYSMEWYKVSFKFGWTILQLCVIAFSIYYGVKEIRNSKYSGEIKYRVALFEGLKILLVSTIINSISIYIYFATNEVKFNSYKTYTNESAIAAMKNAGYPQIEINRYTKIVEEEFTPFNLAKENVIINLLLGLIITLIVASILRKKDTMPANTQL